jgi:Zn-finger nucleic acid-binding protein
MAQAFGRDAFGDRFAKGVRRIGEKRPCTSPGGRTTSMRSPMRSSMCDKTLWGLVLVVVTSLASASGAAVRSCTPYPRPDAGYVTDLAGALSEEQERMLEDWLLKTETAHGVEIVVVTMCGNCDGLWLDAKEFAAIREARQELEENLPVESPSNRPSRTGSRAS